MLLEGRHITKTNARGGVAALCHEAGAQHLLSPATLSRAIDRSAFDHVFFFNLGANRMPISGYGYNFNVRQAVVLNMHPTAAPQGIADVDHTLLESPYPNPAVQTVTLPFYTENASDLMIYSIDGKLVTSCRVQAGYGEATVDVNNLPAGVYIYRLNSQSGKFIVQ